MVQFKEKRIKLQLDSVASLSDLHRRVWECLELEEGISERCSLEYFDGDFDEWLSLDSLNRLGEKAKLRVQERSQISRNPWEWSEAVLKKQAWLTKGFEGTRYLSLLLSEGSTVHHPSEMNSLRSLLDQMGVQQTSVEIVKAFAIHNVMLEASFNTYRATLGNKWRASPQLFKRSDWSFHHAKVAHRKFVLERAEELAARPAWNHGQPMPVVPVFQGTNENVWEICQTGFATAAKLDDGWYGQGTIASLSPSSPPYPPLSPLLPVILNSRALEQASTSPATSSMRAPTPQPTSMACVLSSWLSPRLATCSLSWSGPSRTTRIRTWASRARRAISRTTSSCTAPPHRRAWAKWHQSGQRRAIWRTSWWFSRVRRWCPNTSSISADRRTRIMYHKL